ncbi:MAG: Co2+/Mg2+ efflux protein ApaG [Acetobacteraceae bacterium]|nr:Co2+/Mg2+ efflux protein ApaG [Acetobacteraceae bacterium]
MAHDYSATTRGIQVSVRSFFLADHSRPAEGKFFWAYQVRIENKGAEQVQLLRRSWTITDGRGRIQQVQGDGVIGKQPVLGPGEAFEYTSGTPLDTPSGIMQGAYHMSVAATGEAFEAAIPAFSLDSPHQEMRQH